MYANSFFLIPLLGLFQPAETPPPEPPPSPPKDVASLLESKSVPETKMYFEVDIDGRPGGYHLSSLTPAKGDDGAVYDYRTDSIIRFLNDVRIDAVVTARLKRNFEPVSITLDRQVTHPEMKGPQITAERVLVTDSHIKLVQDAGPNAGKGERVVPKPKEPFVFAMEMVIETIDASKNATLPIAELNPQNGAVSVYRIVSGTPIGGTQEMILQRSDGGIGYRFSVGPEGKIESWAEGRMPVGMKRCSEARFNEVRDAVTKRK